MPVIFGRNFLNDIGAKVDFKKEIVSLKLGKAEKEFHFFKFKDKPLQAHEEEKEKTIEELAALFFSKQAEEANEDSNYEDVIMEDKSLEELESEFDLLPIQLMKLLKSRRRVGTRNYRPQN